MFTEIFAFILELKNKIFSFLDSNHSLKQKITKLKEENEAIKKNKVNKNEYKIKEIAPNSFVYVFKKNKSEQSGPYYCVNCLDSDFKAVTLQIKDCNSSFNILYCPTCKNEYRFLNNEPAKFYRVSTGHFGDKKNIW